MLYEFFPTNLPNLARLKGAAYLTQQLGLAVVSAADQAITKSAAKIAAKRAEEEAVTAAKNNNHLYSDGYQGSSL